MFSLVRKVKKVAINSVLRQKCEVMLLWVRGLHGGILHDRWLPRETGDEHYFKWQPSLVFIGGPAPPRSAPPPPLRAGRTEENDGFICRRRVAAPVAPARWFTPISINDTHLETAVCAGLILRVNKAATLPQDSDLDRKTTPWELQGHLPSSDQMFWCTTYIFALTTKRFVETTIRFVVAAIRFVVAPKRFVVTTKCFVAATKRFVVATIRLVVAIIRFVVAAILFGPQTKCFVVAAKCFVEAPNYFCSNSMFCWGTQTLVLTSQRFVFVSAERFVAVTK